MEYPQDFNEFKKALTFTLKWEGGYVNDPDDPGGETKWGISKRAYPDTDIASLTPAQAADIYYKDYWTKSGCTNVEFPLSACIFDTAVNCGVSRAVRWARDAATAEQFLAQRENHYIQIVKNNPKMQKYMKGWLNRLNDLKKFVQVSLQSDQI